MTRIAAWAVLTLAALYSTFCLALIFVGCFTTTTVFPGDHNGGKAEGFFIFSIFFLAALWFAGGLLYVNSEDKK